MGELYVKGFIRKAGITTAALAPAALLAPAAFLLLWSTLCGGLAAIAQAPAAPAPQATTQAVPAETAQGGTIKGTVISGTVGKPGGVPLPGVAITAKNSLTGKQYTTTTDIEGNYAMTIPKNGRYVVRVELVGFAAETHEVILNGGAVASAKDADFGMELASRAAAAQAQAQQASNATTLQRGIQGLNLNTDSSNADDATAAGAINANTGASLPSLASLSAGDNADAAADSVAVSGQTAQMNGLAGVSEDDMRNRINDAVAEGRANGSIPEGTDVNNIIAGVLGGMMGNAGGPGGRGGQGGPGGGRGGRGGGGAGGGAFRNFNPAQPHGSIFYQGGNAALNSSSWNVAQPTLPHFKPNPSAYSNSFGASIAGSPYIPGLTKPNTKQFVFINMNGTKSLTASSFTGTVPTSAERAGNFQNATYIAGSTAVPITLYDPVTGQPLVNNNLANASVPISQAAKNILSSYYPLCNVSPTCDSTTQTYDNYQTITNGGNNSVTLNTRYMRQLGAATNTPAGRFGGAGGGAGRGQRGQNANQPPVLHQNINITYNFSHNARDVRNIFLPLGGATETTGNSLNVGYVVSYGRLSNNAAINWNRSNAETRNYFTDSATNPNAVTGLQVPTQTTNLADPRFYNGLASFGFGVFQGINNQTPSQTINQTISYSDFIAYRHKTHNWRIGFDIRRVHADSVGGNNPLGSYTFSGYATASPASQVAGTAGTTSGNGFADFLLGLPASTSIQAGLYKDYLRENVYDGYITDDWRARGNLTFNYGMRYEYFGPYSEKNGRLVNLTGINSSGFSSIGCVTPAGVSYTTAAGTVTCASSNGLPSLVNPDRTMVAPRLAFAYRPKAKIKMFSDWVIRGGYGVNYNTGQYAVFARNLSHQEPFSVTQTNDFPLYSTKSTTAPTPTGCTTTQSAYTYTNSQGQTVTRPATTANLSLSNPNSGFNCSTQLTLTNNWAVDPRYRLGMLQVYNFNLQRTLPLQMVFNIGYNGSKASGLDVVGSPNASPSGVSTPGIAPFDFEESLASSHSNQLVVSLQKRQQKGVALGFTYVYAHAIDNASGVGGAVGTPIQNFYNLAGEEGNSSFDQRHNLSGNWLLELPFGPNRRFLNKGGVMSKVMDGFNLSGTFVFGTGNYFTPQYSGNESEAASGNTFIQRPDRVFSQPLKGAGSLTQWFNTAAFTAPAGIYGTASQGSIEGPGTVSVNASLSRTAQLGGTNSLEARVTASNVFNTVQYSGINVSQNSSAFGQVSGAAPMRSLIVIMRYRF